MSDGTIVFLCPACGYKARIPTQYAGHTIRCPGCQSPQVAKLAAPTASTGKTISIMKVASTPVPFTLPPDQAAALTAASTTPLPMELGIQAVGVSPGIPVLGNPSGVRPRIDTLLPDNTPRANVALPTAAKPVAGATIDFTCTMCRGRMRIPAQYIGKSILCPKCSAPQKVTDSKLPAQPMDTTRSIKSGEPTQTQTPPLPSPRIARPPSGEIVPQTAPLRMPHPLDAAPTQVHRTESDSALARAGVPRRRGVSESGTHPAPPMTTPIPPPPRAVEASEESSVIPSDHVPAEPGTPSSAPAANAAKVVRSGRKPAASASASSASDSAATVAVSPKARSQGSSSGLLPVLAIGLLLVAALGGCGWLWTQLSAAEARTAEVEQAKGKAQAKAAADLAAVEARLTALEQQLKEAHAAVEAAHAAAEAAQAAALVVPEPTPAPAPAPTTETPIQTPAP